MFLVGLISWWYGRGWNSHWHRSLTRFNRTVEFFSVGQLAATLFSPFRQISAGSVQGPVGAQLRGLLDSLVSRFIGSLVRGGTILFGLIVILLQTIYELLLLGFWWLLPLLPVVGGIAFAVGWVPSWR